MVSLVLLLLTPSAGFSKERYLLQKIQLHQYVRIAWNQAKAIQTSAPCGPQHDPEQHDR